MSTHAIEALYATGHWLLSNTRHAEAAEVFRVMTFSQPTDERGWLALGACHEAIGQKRLAIELYRIASTCASPAVRCTIARARAHRSLEQDEQADEAFADAHALALAHGEHELAQLATHERNESDRSS